MDTINDYQIIEITSVEQVLRFWTFLLDGFNSAIAEGKEDYRPSVESFLQVCLRALKEGLILLAKRKGENFISYCVVIDGTAPFAPKTALVAALYVVPGKSRFVVKAIRNYVETWAKVHRYQFLQGHSFRMSGATFRYYERVWNMERVSVLLSKKL